MPRSLACLGSSASRKPSPMKLMARTVNSSARHGEQHQPPLAWTGRSPSNRRAGSPAGVGRRHAEAEERQRRLGRMAPATVNVMAHDDRTEGVRDEVAEDDAASRSRRGRGRLDELLLLQAEHDAADDAGRGHPATKVKQDDHESDRCPVAEKRLGPRLLRSVTGETISRATRRGNARNRSVTRIRTLSSSPAAGSRRRLRPWCR